MGRYRGELSSEGRHEVCGSGMRGNRAAALTSTLDSPGSDDLLVDNEEGMLGKVSIHLPLSYIFSLCVSWYPLILKRFYGCYEILQKYYKSGRNNTLHTI